MKNRLKNKKAIEEYWLDLLSSPLSPISLPWCDNAAGSERSGGEVQTFTYELTVGTTAALRRICMNSHTALTILFIGGLNVLLHKYTGSSDIIAATTKEGKWVLCRDEVHGFSTVGEVIERTRQSVLKAYNYRDFSFAELMEKLKIRKKEEEPAIYHAAFICEEIQDGHELPGKFNFSVLTSFEEDAFTLRVEYNTVPQLSGIAERFFLNYGAFFTGIREKLTIPLDELDIISAEEKKQLLVRFNETEAAFPADMTVHDFFAGQAGKTPDSRAISQADRCLTYSYLDERAGCLTHSLQVRGTQPGGIVGIRVNRSIEMIVGILGILKAGAAYLPIDPSYPDDRVRFLMADSGANILLTPTCVGKRPEPGVEARRGEPCVPPHKSTSIAYVIYTSGSTGRPKGVMVEHRSVINRLTWMQRAYPLNADDVIVQKTPIVFDVSVWELFWWTFCGASLCLLGHGEEKDPRAIAAAVERAGVTTMHFVPSMLEVFLAYVENLPDFGLSKLASLRRVFASGEALAVHHARKFNRLLNRENGTQLVNLYGPTEATVDVTCFNCTPEARFEQGIPIGKPIDNTRLYIIDKKMNPQPIGVTGELCIAGAGLARGYLNNPELTFEKFKYFASGGPTTWAGDKLFEKSGAKTFPKAFVNKSFVREFHTLVSAKFSHKNFYDGKMVRSTEMARRAFCGSPRRGAGGKKIYKTGDLTRWLPGGIIEFLGRIDHQIKIRGYRVETGEIEEQLLKHRSVRAAVVLAKERDEGDKYLCGYIIADGNITGQELRNSLAKELPGYMIPAYFVMVDSIPVTNNGKVDRKALLALDVETTAGQSDLTAPGNPREELLAAAWKSVLGRKELGVNENFFRIGGDSIISIRVISKLNKAGWSIEMSDIFRYPTIRALAPRLKKIRRTADQRVITGVLPLTPIQHWFFANQDKRYRHRFNQAVLLSSRDFIPAGTIETLFLKLQEHHDALRMTFEEQDGEIIQRNQGADSPISLVEYDYRDLGTAEVEKKMADRANEIQDNIDLTAGPLMKSGLFHLKDGDRLLIAVHHLVIDGISWRILLEDLETLYRLHKNREVLALPEKTDSYKVWSEKLAEYAHSPVFLKEREYWAELLSREIPALKTDFPAENIYMEDADVLSFALNEAETNRLLTGTNGAYNTEIRDILLTGLALALERTFGCDRAAVALEGHGREEIIERSATAADDVTKRYSSHKKLHKKTRFSPNSNIEGINITRTIGWFTAIFPFILEICNKDDIGRQIKEIKESIRRIPNGGAGYGILRYLSVAEHKKGLVFGSKPSISFNYLGRFDTETAEKAFALAGESPGNPHHGKIRQLFALDIGGIVRENRLRISITYNKKQYKPGTIRALADHYEKALHDITGHCTALKEPEFTPADFIYTGLSIDRVDELNRRYPLEDTRPLTPMQEGMMFHTLYERAGDPYYLQVSYRFRGELDMDLAKRSLNSLFSRYDILRTVFVYEGLPCPLQLLLKEKPSEFYYKDTGSLSTAGRDTYISRYKRNDKARSFDLANETLLRLAVIGVGDADFYFIWSWHHIILDGWSLALLNEEFFNIYSCLKDGTEYRSTDIRPYGDYIRWLANRDEEEAGHYWETYLSGYEELASVPGTGTDRDGSGDKARFSFRLDSETGKALESSAKKDNVTVGTVFSTIWGMILSKYNNREDVVFGSVVSGRPANFSGIDKMVGLFINTVPLRVRYAGETRYKDLLRRIQNEALESGPYHFFSLAKIQKRSELNRQLFDHILVFENYPITDRLKEFRVNDNSRDGKSQSRVSDVDVFEQTNFDLDLTVIPGESYTVEIDYNAGMYEKSFIERIGIHFSNLCRQVIKDENVRIKELTLLSGEEKKQLLFEFNDTGADYPAEKVIYELFEEQVEKKPANTALICADGRLTYGELNGRVNSLTGLLIGRGVKAGTPVGVMVERSAEMIIAIFAVLKAGGAYIPLSPDYPPDRVTYMLSGSNSRLLLTDKQTGTGGNESHEIINVRDESLYSGDKKNPGKRNSSSNPAYIIYTSGSTGRPKGVMVEHGSLINRLNWMQRKYRIDERDTILQKTTVTFDVSVWEIFWWANTGGRVCMLMPGGEKNPGQIIDAIATHKITVLHFVPSMLNAFLDYVKRAGKPGSLTSLKQVIASGEALLLSHVRLFKEVLCSQDGPGLANLYGPTEATVDVSYFDCFARGMPANIPIGKPIDNIRLYILDKNLNVQPVGIPGELCIAGVGLARGYLNNPELTFEKFIASGGPLFTDTSKKFAQKTNFSSIRSETGMPVPLGVRARRPLFEKSGAKTFAEGHRPGFPSYGGVPRSGGVGLSPTSNFQLIYKTGDLARWQADGNIEFLGRIDTQVKIRGFRIELEEIESKLLAYKKIKEAVVLAKRRGNGAGDKDLFAYIVSAESISKPELREYLGKTLPGYMVPAHFVRVDAIPLTSSGKVDRKALKAIEEDRASGSIPVKPRSHIEKIIAQAWQEVLRTNRINVNENFFDMGGTSIDMISLSWRFKELFKIDNILAEMFRYSTVASLAEYIRRSQGETGRQAEDMKQPAAPVEKIRAARKRQREKRKLDL